MGVGQECLAVDRELGAAGSAGEQARIQVSLQCGDALGDSLLGDREHGGGFLELASVRGNDECTHGIEIHTLNLLAQHGVVALRYFSCLTPAFVLALILAINGKLSEGGGGAS